MNYSLKKAVFPVAGIGSRFLPATKANPKEMLPVVDKPLIQYAVEEAIKAGLTEMIFVTSGTKRAIEDHFDSHYELEQRLLAQGKKDLCELVRSISPSNIKFTYVRQPEMLGLGHALLCARHVIGQEPFAVLLADDLIDDKATPCLSAMVQHYNATGESLVAVQEVPREIVHQYGVVDIPSFQNNIAPIRAIVEKPTADKAPSNYAAIGRYIFTHDLFDYLAQTNPDVRNEIQLTDAIQKLLHTHTVDAFCFEGKRYDCGSKLGYVKATVEYALNHPEIGVAFQEYLSQSSF